MSIMETKLRTYNRLQKKHNVPVPNVCTLSSTHYPRNQRLTTSQTVPFKAGHMMIVYNCVLYVYVYVYVYVYNNDCDVDAKCMCTSASCMIVYVHVCACVRI